MSKGQVGYLAAVLAVGIGATIGGLITSDPGLLVLGIVYLVMSRLIVRGLRIAFGGEGERIIVDGLNRLADRLERMGTARRRALDAAIKEAEAHE